MIKKETKKVQPKTSPARKITAAETRKVAPEPKKIERYIEGVGRRKTSIARVRITSGQGEFRVNEKDVKQYFSLPRLLAIVGAPFLKLKIADLNVSVKVLGGGIHAQAEAVRLGLSRALAAKNPDLEKRLHKLGFLTRDPRMVERKKYGLKKARRAPQWAKR